MIWLHLDVPTLTNAGGVIVLPVIVGMLVLLAHMRDRGRS